MIKAINPPPRKRANSSPPKQKRRRPVFRKSDVLRAIDAAKAGGLAVGAVELRPDSTIRISSPEVAKASANPDIFDEWEARL